ncbi:hypothetical protein Q1695_006808 [Nippostrongylus brasiliensis]|nr:hypothetical protein Q1695_006808 [Nippostrongylus brasiliensis]
MLSKKCSFIASVTSNSSGNLAQERVEIGYGQTLNRDHGLKKSNREKYSNGTKGSAFGRSAGTNWAGINHDKEAERNTWKGSAIGRSSGRNWADINHDKEESNSWKGLPMGRARIAQTKSADTDHDTAGKGDDKNGEARSGDLAPAPNFLRAPSKLRTRRRRRSYDYWWMRKDSKKNETLESTKFARQTSTEPTAQQRNATTAPARQTSTEPIAQQRNATTAPARQTSTEPTAQQRNATTASGERERSNSAPPPVSMQRDRWTFPPYRRTTAAESTVRERSSTSKSTTPPVFMQRDRWPFLPYRRTTAAAESTTRKHSSTSTSKRQTTAVESTTQERKHTTRYGFADWRREFGRWTAKKSATRAPPPAMIPERRTRKRKTRTQPPPITTAEAPMTEEPDLSHLVLDRRHREL